MKQLNWNQTQQFLDEAIGTGLVPGALAQVGIGDETLWQYIGGFAELGANPRPMQADTWFDLASLTKVMSTLPAILRLIERNRIRLDDPVSQFLSGFSERWNSVTIRHLLTHTGGLVSHRDYHATLRGRESFLAAIEQEPWDSLPGTKVTYSDLGFILLGAIVESVSDMPLDKFVTEYIFHPLGIKDATYCADPSIQLACAATEAVNQQAWVGTVHDENARAMGGVAGHAGLFATLGAVSRYTALWAGHDHSLLSSPVKSLATQLWTKGLGGYRGLGWVLAQDPYDVSGTLWPQTGAGHTGFTGTSIQFDGSTGLWAVLLTNRVHFGRDKNISPLRRQFHDMVASTVL